MMLIGLPPLSTVLVPAQGPTRRGGPFNPLLAPELGPQTARPRSRRAVGVGDVHPSHLPRTV
jgi:hypothetical protein